MILFGDPRQQRRLPKTSRVARQPPARRANHAAIKFRRGEILGETEGPIQRLVYYDNRGNASGPGMHTEKTNGDSAPPAITSLSPARSRASSVQKLPPMG